MKIEETEVISEIIAPVLLNSVGIHVKETHNGLKFVYSDKGIVDELGQLGFSIDVLKMQGGETTLPILADHLDEQSALEAYWSALAEKARYELKVCEDEFEMWYSVLYSQSFSALQDRGVPKPTQKEVEARISRKKPNELRSKKNKLRIFERRYRILKNACWASIVTKGKMLQSLRNVIQGDNKYGLRIPNIDNEVGDDLDITNIKSKAD